MIPSIYKTVKVFKETKDKRILLKQKKMDGSFFVQRELRNGDYFVYTELMKASIEGIPKIYDVFIEKGWLIVQEEYIAARRLDQMLPLSSNQAADVLCQLCDILGFLHGLDPPILHRDIKPENLFYRDGKVILFDFDIARRYDKTKQKDTTLLGSVGYAPPEQFGFSQTTVQSDIYSCGKLFQVLLTGDMDKEARGKYAMIISKAMSMDPKDRYQNVKDLKKAIQTGGFVFPGWNNRTKKGKIGAWIGWLAIFLVMIKINPAENVVFVNDIYYMLSCFYCMALMEFVICNRHLLKTKYMILRVFIGGGVYFLLLVLGLVIFMALDLIML